LEFSKSGWSKVIHWIAIYDIMKHGRESQRAAGESFVISEEQGVRVGHHPLRGVHIIPICGVRRRKP
jgi:hypothetical protein